MAQIFVSGVAHFFVVVGGSKIHERLAHFFIDIYSRCNPAGLERHNLQHDTVHKANYEELRDLEEREKRKEKEHGRE